MGERKEACMRILVAIVSGIVIGVWGYVIFIIAIIHWLMVVFSGKRNKIPPNIDCCWFFVKVEIKVPIATVEQTKVNDAKIKINNEPRMGTPKRKMAADRIKGTLHIAIIT